MMWSVKSIILPVGSFFERMLLLRLRASGVLLLLLCTPPSCFVRGGRDLNVFVGVNDGIDSGDDECPCLTRSEFEADLLEQQVLSGGQKTPWQETIEREVGSNATVWEYGLGCAAHDLESIKCSAASKDKCTSTVPLPADCELSYCTRSWCYVDPDKCRLTYKPSVMLKGRYYSYATCGDLDRFTYSERLKSLKGETFKVGFVSNTGGWKGSYHPEGSFAKRIDEWHGPLIDFIREAAFEGGFSINMTAPPEALKPKSESFFGSSSFDFCVYATSLGYLDFCVGAFTINEKRSSVTTMFNLFNEPIYLMVFSEGANTTSWEVFMTSAKTIFQPFTNSVWFMIIFFALPVFGFLMLVHEYGTPGSAYPATEPILVHKEDGESYLENRRISMWKHVANAYYASFLSFFLGTYDTSVITVGGKLNLLGIASFVMLILAVYTANLAAILTGNIQKPEVNTIEAAIRHGYNFCADRKLAENIIASYGIDEKLFVPDPVDLGGDGLPGFNCPNCQARTRSFDYMRLRHNDPSLYCNAAIATHDDLQVLQSKGAHCDKVKVGESLGQSHTGFPIFDEKAPALNSLFDKLKTDGDIEKIFRALEPLSACDVQGGEGTALNIHQLTGIWVISFGFALAGLALKCVKWCHRRHKSLIANKRKKNDDDRRLRACDQWLNPPPYNVTVNGYSYDAENNALHRL